jgi:hypothetical protein
MQDEDGLPTTSGGLKEIEYVYKSKNKNLHKNQLVVKEAIEFLHYQKQQKTRHEGGDIMSIVVTAEELNDYVKDKFGDIKNISSAKTRAIKSLIEKGEITGDITNGYKPSNAQQF